MNRYRFTSLAESIETLKQVRGAARVETSSPMSLHQTLIHLAQSIEGSMRGYPQLKPAWMRATIGPLVAGIFSLRGQMKHNLAAPVPGEPAISAEGALEPAWDRLLSAISTFQKWTGETHPHFMFGKQSQASYDRLHAMHLADHFSHITFS